MLSLLAASRRGRRAEAGSGRPPCVSSRAVFGNSLVSERTIRSRRYDRPPRRCFAVPESVFLDLFRLSTFPARQASLVAKNGSIEAESADSPFR